MRKSVYALPPRVSFLVSDLSRFGDPATRPPGGFPRRLRAGCPRVRAFRARQPIRRSDSDG